MALGDGCAGIFAKSQAGGTNSSLQSKMHDTLIFSDGESFFHKLEEAHELGHLKEPARPAVFLLWHVIAVHV